VHELEAEARDSGGTPGFRGGSLCSAPTERVVAAANRRPHGVGTAGPVSRRATRCFRRGKTAIPTIDGSGGEEAAEYAVSGMKTGRCWSATASMRGPSDWRARPATCARFRS